MGDFLMFFDHYLLASESYVHIRIRMIGQQFMLIGILEECVTLNGIAAGTENVVKVSGGGYG